MNPIDTDNIHAAVIGLGKLGLPLYLSLLDAEIDTIGLDLNSELVSDLEHGRFLTTEPGVNNLLQECAKRMDLTSDYNKLSVVDIAYVIVPTPSDVDGKFDESFVRLAIVNLINTWKESVGEKSIVVVSTVMPGTCNKLQEEISDALSSHRNLRINLIYSPEFIALGTVLEDIAYPDMVLVGKNDDSSAALHLVVMNRIIKNKALISTLNLGESEIVKLLINAYVTMKISFANFIAEIAMSAEFNVSANRVAEAVGLDKRINPKYLKPGLAYGGPCFPRDNRALMNFAISSGVEATLAQATDIINNRQTKRVISEIQTNFPSAKSIAILGLSYKTGSIVTEESSAVKISNALAQMGYLVSGWDPILKKRPEDLDSRVKFCVDVTELLESDLFVKTQNSLELAPIELKVRQFLDLS